MTRAELVELAEIAKAVSTGTDGLYVDEAMPFLRDVADTLQKLAWQRNGDVCVCCPRPHPAHTCGCPHAQAKKRLIRFGVWP